MKLEAYKTPQELPDGAPGRIAKLLGLKVNEHTDELWLADQIANGLKARSADALSNIIGSSNVVGLLIPEATLRRAKTAKKALSKEMSERLYEVTKVLDAVSTAYRGDTKAIEHFLSHPHPLLDGRSPYEVAASSSAGSDVVLSLVRRAQAGIAL